MKYPSDHSFHQFALGLNSANLINKKLLELGKGYFVDRFNSTTKESGSVLYARSCYESLSLLMFNDKNRITIVTGTSGVGKTFFRNYFAYYLLKNIKGDVSILFSISPSPHFSLLIRKDGEIITYGYEPNHPIALLRNVPKHCPIFSLSDVSKGDSDSCVVTSNEHDDFRFFMFTSPNEKSYKELIKEKARVYYMPLWSESELFEWASYLEFSDQKYNVRLKTRFDLYGGIARVFFGDEDTFKVHEDKVNSAISSFDFKAAANVELSAVNEDILRTLIYLKVNDNFQGYVYHFATDYILNRLANLMIEKMKNQANGISSIFSTDISCVKGFLYERICHNIILHSKNAFRVRPLGNSQNSLGLTGKRGDLFLDFSNTTLDKFSQKDAFTSISNMKHHTYLLPVEPHFPVVDAIIKLDEKSPHIFLQMTISQIHKSDDKIKSDIFQNLCASLKLTEIHVIFVPSPQTYSSFKQQEINLGDNVIVYQYALDIMSSLILFKIYNILLVFDKKDSGLGKRKLINSSG